jgi:NitT/TauT family transport system ATP-binding protein
MAQRVALCRVLAADPTTILMDEPFGALDEFTRERLNLELLHARHSRILPKDHSFNEGVKTTVFVTHNIGEAVFLSDRVAVMKTSPGRLVSVVDVPLPRPRTVERMRDPLYTECIFDIRERLAL